MSFNLTSVLNSHTETYLSENVWISQPCRVVRVVSLETLTVDVQPLVNEKYSNGTFTEHDTILNVPVVMLGSSTSMVSLPVNEHDTVLCVFSQRELTAFKSGTGSPANPNTFRLMDKTDAIAIPGLYTNKNSLNQPSKRNLDHNPLDVVVAHNIGTGAESEIRLKTDGTIQHTGDTTIVGNLTINGDFSCTGTGEFTGDVTIGGISFLEHIHVAPSGGGNTTAPTP